MDYEGVMAQADSYLAVALGNHQPVQELLESCDQTIERLERRKQGLEAELLRFRELRAHVLEVQQSMLSAQAV